MKKPGKYKSPAQERIDELFIEKAQRSGASNEPAQLSYTCPHCNGEMAYEPENCDMNSQCPHCQKEIELSRANDAQTREKLLFKQAGVDRAFEYGGIVKLKESREKITLQTFAGWMLGAFGFIPLFG
jgi:hypothetical protein